MNVIVAIERLMNSPAYIRCNADLRSVCKRMERLTLARYSQAEKDLALRYVSAVRFADVKGEKTAATSTKENSAILTQWQEETVKAKTQLAFATIDAVKHENVKSRFAYDEVYVISRLRNKAVSGKATPKTERSEDVCLACQEEREGRAETNVGGHTCYADRGKKTKDGKGQYRPTGQATCEKLFTRGEKETDGFSRTIALRYLSKRMVFAPRTNAKSVKTQDGNAILPGTLKARKTSSSRHAVAFYLASDIEDTIQDGWTLYQLATLFINGRDAWTPGQAEQFDKMTEQELKTVATLARNRTGNRLHDTCSACQRAKNLMTRARFAERKRLEKVAYRMKQREDKERGLANRYYDDELDALLNAVSEHKTENVKQLAEVLGTYPMDIIRRFARIKARCEKQEAEQAQRDAQKRLEQFRDWEAACKRGQWKLAAKYEQ